MGNNIKGITIEIDGNVTKLSKALGNVNKEVRDTQSELREVEKLLKLDPANTEALTQKQKLLKNAIGETKTKLDVLKTAEAQVQEQFQKGEATEEQYRAIKREIEATEISLQRLEDQAKSSNSTLESVGNAFGTVGEKATTIGKKLMPVTAGITALGGTGIAAAMELDTGYDTIITKTGATGEALEELTEVADNIFSSMPTNMEAAGTAVGEINTRFQATGEILEDLSTQFIQFSEINGTDLNNSIGKVDKIMEQWNIDLEDTGQVLGLITKKGQDTGISVETLMDSIQKNGATFKEMGLNVVQSADLLAQFEANGVNAETAIVGLRKSVKVYTDQGKSADEAIKLTIDSIKNAKDETEALSIAQEVFGTKGAAEMSNAIREGRIDLDSLSTSMTDYGTVVEDTFNATLDPWDEAKIATNNLKLAAAELGTSLLSTLQPIITKVVDKVKDFTQWFKNLSDGQKETIIKVAALVAALGPALIIFGKMSTGISGIVKTVGTLGTKFGGLSGVFTAITGPVGAVIAIIAALAAGFIALYNTNDEFRAKVDAAISGVKAAFSEMWEKIQPIIEQVKEAFMNLLTALQPVFEFIITAVGAVLNGIINAVEPIIQAVKNVIDFVTNIVNAVIALFKGDFDGFFEYLGAAFQNAIDFIKNIFGAIGSFFSGVWDGIKGVFSGVGNWFKDKFSDGFNKVKNAWSTAGETFSGIKEKITGAFANIGNWFQDKFSDGFEKVKSTWSTAGETFSGIRDKVTDAFSSVGDWFKDKFKEGYENSKNAWNTAGETFSGIKNKVTGAFSNVGEWFGTQFSNAWTNIKNIFSKVGDFFGGIWDNIKNCFSDVGVKIGSVVGDAFKTAINGCLATIEGIVNGFIGMINGVIGVINMIPGVSLGKIGELSIPRLAKGGVLSEGTAMVAEAGPELLSMVNGKAVVTPLTGTARNQAAEKLGTGSSGYNQTINITSPKALTPYEVARQTRLQTRSMILAVQRR